MLQVVKIDMTNSKETIVFRGSAEDCAAYIESRKDTDEVLFCEPPTCRTGNCSE